MTKGTRAAARSISFKSADGRQIVIRFGKDEAYCSVDGGDAHTIKEVRYMQKQQKLFFPGSKVQGVKLCEKEQLETLKKELDNRGIENDFDDGGHKQPTSVTIGDHVKAEKHSVSKVYRIVNEMKAWNRYELEDVTFGDLTWRDAKALTLCPNSRLAIAWDPAMSNHGVVYDDILTSPERPTRITHLWDHLLSINILDSCHVLQTTQQCYPTDADFDKRVQYLKECICAIHTESHYEKVLSGDVSCIRDETNSAETQMTKGTPRAALTAVDVCLRVADQVIEGNAPSGLAIVRPPGHHAGADYAMGFCYFNNVAITAATLLKQPTVNRVAILDWDVHHGNGIQDVFYNSSDVLYISLHVYANGKFYPGTGRGQDIGSENAAGYNINVSWSEVSAGDSDCDMAFTTVVMPVLKQFAPDVLLISAGFDAAQGDPLGQCNVTPNGFGQMTEHLLSLPNCKIIAALEGGYDLNCLGDCTTSVIKMLQKHAVFPPKPFNPTLTPSLYTNSEADVTPRWGNARPSSFYNLSDLVTILKKHWSCLDESFEFLQAAAADIRGKETAKMLRRRFEVT